MDRELLIAKTRVALHDAIQAHMRALYGPLVTTDYLVVAENMMEDEELMLHGAISEHLSGWKLRGMSYHGLKFMHELTG